MRAAVRRGLGSILICGAFATSTVAAQTATDGAAVELTIDRAPKPPVLDGRLDDDAWQRPPLVLGEC